MYEGRGRKVVSRRQVTRVAPATLASSTNSLTGLSGRLATRTPPPWAAAG